MLGNPLRFVDPTGLVWVSSDDVNNPYRWTDECGEKETCYTAVAANVAGNLRVYGSAGDFDVFDVAGIGSTVDGATARLINVSFMFSNPDAYIQDTQVDKENYLSVNAAAALFNTGVYYHSLYPKDDKLAFQGGAKESGFGGPAHVRSHRGGDVMDLLYMSPAGKVMRGEGQGASARADPGRVANIVSGLISTQGSRFTEFGTLTPDRFGGAAGRAFGLVGHGNHMHFQYPVQLKRFK